MTGSEATRGGSSGDVDNDPSMLRTRVEIGEALTDLRRRSGMSLRALAKEVDRPLSTIAGWCRGENLPFPGQHHVFRAMIQALGVADPEPWVDALNRVVRIPAPRETDDAPYRGLRNYRADDARWFFGRDELIDQAVDRIWRIAHSRSVPHLMLFVGASGSGKTSLVEAGVIPALEPSGWRTVICTPGPSPLEHLAAALSAASGHEHGEIETLLRDEPGRVHEVVKVDGAGLMVSIDQFEELYTECRDPIERRRFQAAVWALADSNGSMVVLLTVRADFYGEVASNDHLARSLQDAQMVVGPMGRRELASAITEPAAAAGFSIDDELRELLLDSFIPAGALEGHHDAGALPLLSHALLETWMRARRGRMTVADYHAAGGISGAVEATAEDALGSLSKAQQRVAREVLLRLVHLDDDWVVTRRTSSFDELAGLGRQSPDDANAAPPDAGMAVTPPVADVGNGPLPASLRDEPPSGAADDDHGSDVDVVLEVFARARLLTVNEQGVQITHETLLSAWPRLGQWIAQAREELRARRIFAEASRVWAESGREASTLAAGARLEAMLSVAESGPAGLQLSRTEREFLAASVAERDRSAADARRRARRLGTVAAVALVAAMTAGVLAVYANTARSDATRSRDAALSRETALNVRELRATDPNLAAQLAIAGHDIMATPEARSELLDSEALPFAQRHVGVAGTTALAVSDSGDLVVSGSTETSGDVQLFETGDNGLSRAGVVPAQQPGTDVYSLTLGSDQSLLAVGSTAPAVTLWDVADPQQPALVIDELDGGPIGAIQDLAISPDGHELAAVGAGDGVYRWDITDPFAPRALPTLPSDSTTWTVAYSPAGDQIAAGNDDGLVERWDVQGDPNPIDSLDIGNAVLDVSYAPDGQTLAAGGRNNQVQLWDISSRSVDTIELAEAQFDSYVNVTTFNADGSLFAAGSSDRTVRVWDTGSRTPVAELPHPDVVTSVGFVPDESMLATAAADGATRIWDVDSAIATRLAGRIFNLSTTRDGSLMAAFSTTDMGVWELSSDGDMETRSTGTTAPADRSPLIGSGDIAPDGSVIAAGAADGSVHLFNTRDPSQPTLMEPSLGGSDALVQAVVFSDDGRLLAAGGDDHRVRIWRTDDLDDPEPDGVIVVDGIVLSLAWSPSDHHLAIASADGNAYLFDVSHPDAPELTATVGPFDTEVYSTAFDPTGDTLAVGGLDAAVTLWDITDITSPVQLGQSLDGPRSQIFSVDFHPDGDRLGAAVADGTTWLWEVSDLEKPTKLAVLDGANGATYTVRFGPSGNSLHAAGSGQRVDRWTLGDERAIERICARVGDQLTLNEWSRYLPSRDADPPCRPPS